MAKSLLVLASSLPNSNPAASPSSPQNPKAPLILPITSNTATPNKNNVQKKLQVLRMERAIGAGSYRDAEPPASVENALADDDTSSSNGNQFEGSLQKKARETGEWLAHKTETEFRISEKQGLEFLFKWALPISLLAMMVAVGVVKLPFLSPFLDDFIL
ncbi:Probable NAD(P)H dehydrogenase subunit CRR3, chloroplastic [Linum grandiflorum]